ncbi:MAG: IS3 family transposase [Gemmataceae bacterium]|nr:IS3 family transposase [Gemmataceae bacterium]
MGGALGVSASGYYAWASRPGRPAEQWRRELVGAIEEVHAEVKRRYGSPRMTAGLKARGHACSENTVAKLRSAHGIKARVPRRPVRTTGSNRRRPAAANLLDRGPGPARPSQVRGADITYIPTREGWPYPAVVGDLFGRMVVGWATAESMESRPVVDALEMAPARRRPGAGLLAHSGRGSRSASDHYRRVLAAAGIVCSMSGVGRCWGSAPVEPFSGRLRCELAPDGMFATRDQARVVLFEYPEAFDNPGRRHSSLGFVSPAEFERAHDQTQR